MGKTFQDKVVFITGASAGIGEALAKEFAKKGAILVLLARRKSKLDELCKNLANQGVKALAVECDVLKEEQLQNAVKQSLLTFGKIDVVIANAGFGVTGRMDRLSVADYHRQFETNVYGVLRTLYATLPEIKRSQGQLVLIGSVAGYISLPEGSPYSMSKFAIHALANSLYFELKPDGVSVTLIAPGFVESEFRQIDNQGNLHSRPADPAPPLLVMPVTTAARKVVRAIACKRKEYILTFHGKVAVYLQRHFPWVLRLMFRLGLKNRREPKE